MMHCQNVTRLPSPARTLWMGFRNRKARHNGTEEIPALSASLPGLAINDNHLTRYKALCGLKGGGFRLLPPHPGLSHEPSPAQSESCPLFHVPDAQQEDRDVPASADSPWRTL